MVAPNARNIGMVYQQYALFPHMSVFRERGPSACGCARVPAAELRRRVGREPGAGEARRVSRSACPRTLSGGQQQRVALARALGPSSRRSSSSTRPLSKPRCESCARDMQLELRRLQAQLGITAVYVTHDQSEALAMSDRIAVMNHGRLEQLDTPAELYHHPRTAFVAGFIGQAKPARRGGGPAPTRGTVSAAVNEDWGLRAAGGHAYRGG